MNDLPKNHYDNFAFNRLLKVLEQLLKGLEKADADRSVISAYKALVRYLRKLGNEDVRRILSGTTSKQEDRPAEDDQLAEHQIAELPLGDVESIIHDARYQKKHIERIAMVRFGMTKWEVSKINRDKLIEKIETLISNQRTHEAIGRLAGGPDGP